MAPLSKDTSGIILPYDTYGTHLDASNNTIDDDLEVRNFKAAGNVLADIWSESVIGEHPVVSRCIDPQDRDLNARTTEDWKSKHVSQSQYMLQIVKCKDKSCCQFRTNYLDFFPNRFLPPPVPLNLPSTD